MKYTTLILCLSLALASCHSKNTFCISVISNNSLLDSAYITETITGRIVKKIPLKGTNNEVSVDIDSTTIGQVHTKDGEHSYLTILRPNKNIRITINSDSTISTNNIADSLLNFLWKGNNNFIAQNSAFIFTTSKVDSVVSIFEQFGTTRKDTIEKYSDRLGGEEKELLLYQNEARLYAFLFYYGRILKKLPPQNSFFSFANNIDNNTKWAKSLPHNLLYKHEANYLTINNALDDIHSFLTYIGSQTSNKDLFAFLKANYIREIIESPSYWEHHQPLLNLELLEAINEEEKENIYYDLIQKPSKSYLASQKGEKAYDFVAERMDGTTLKLSDLKGKMVFVDTWASWCGPCIQHRPMVLELAEKYKDDPRIEILMVSVDASKEEWARFLTKKGQLDNNGDLMIINGLKTKYGNSFNIKSIPKYMLIDEFGTIIDANIKEPSLAVVERIERELKRM